MGSLGNGRTHSLASTPRAAASASHTFLRTRAARGSGLVFEGRVFAADRIAPQRSLIAKDPGNHAYPMRT